MEAWMSKLKVTALIAASGMLLMSQSGSSTIAGIVKDQVGAAVPGVKIKIVNIESGTQFDTVTNEAGLYRAGALLPGNYQLDAEAPGFDHVSRGPITLAVSQTLAIDLNL